MNADAELDELERFETIVRGPGWVPDIDNGAEYEEWTGKWYTPTRPDGTGGHSLALYGDDEELLYARYIAVLRNASPRLLRAARHLSEFDKDGIVAENEALRMRLREAECARDEQRERAENLLRQPHCESCTCGMVELEWSDDRATWVRLSDHGQVADAIISCALDHSYDRTGSGVPYGLPSAIEAACVPVVDKHLSAVCADWAKARRSVWMTEEQRDAFKADLVKAIGVASHE